MEKLKQQEATQIYQRGGDEGRRGELICALACLERGGRFDALKRRELKQTKETEMKDIMVNILLINIIK